MSRASLDKDPHEVAAMFDGVASGYDRANSFMTFGFDRRWRTGRGGGGELVTDRPSLASAAPLYFGIATGEQGNRVAARLERDFLKPGVKSIFG